MMKNLRWLVPMGLVCIAGPVATAQARLDVWNQVEKTWRLRCAQDLPALTVLQGAGQAGGKLGEPFAPAKGEEFTLPGQSLLQLSLDNEAIRRQPLRFHVLHEGMDAPDGTQLVFQWDERQDKAVARIEYPEDQQALRKAMRREAVMAGEQRCLIRKNNLTGDVAEDGPAPGSSGSGLRVPDPGLPIGTSGKEPKTFEPGPGAGAGSASARPQGPAVKHGTEAGAGAGSGSGLPLGPAPKAPARIYGALPAIGSLQPVSAGREESKAGGEAPKGPLRTRQLTLNNESSVDLKATMSKVEEVAQYRRTSLDGLAAGQLEQADSAVPMPAGSTTTVEVSGYSPFRPAVQVTQPVTPTRALRIDWTPFGTSPARDGRQPHPVKLAENKAEARVVARQEQEGTLTIRNVLDAKDENALAASLDRLDLTTPTVGFLISGGAPAAGASLEELGAETPITDADMDDHLDLDVVAGKDAQAAERAVFKFLSRRLQRNHLLIRMTTVYARRAIEAMDQSGYKDLDAAHKAGLFGREDLLRTERWLVTLGHQPVIKELERRWREWMAPEGRTFDRELALSRLNAAHQGWYEQSIRRSILALLARGAHLASASSGAGSGSGSGAKAQ